MNRRDFLWNTGQGLGAIALNWMLQQSLQASPINKSSADSSPPKKLHHPAKAKQVIFLFMVGGPSPIDLFDPKPILKKHEGKPLPASLGKFPSQFTNGESGLLPSTRKFKQYGECGHWFSDLLPNLATCADDISFLHGCWCNSSVHAPAMYELHSGRTLMGHPSLGSWVSYGLGSLTDNLPTYCVMPQPEGVPEGGAPCWSQGYLPGIHQGTLLRKGANPILNLKPALGIDDRRNQAAFDLLKKLHDADRESDPEMQARTKSYELAFRMQSVATEAVDLSKESEATKKMYGLDRKETEEFGTRLLLTRRLIERGVRFVTVYHGGGPISMQWDAHDDINSNHEKMCGHADQPIAALLKDLKRTGLLKETLVVWCSEFGRTPFSQGGTGRDHNHYGFSMWLAGGGVKGGRSIGATDEFGMKAVKKRTSVNDFHATILHLLGLDHEKLTFRHNGRDERLTDVAGEVVSELWD